MIHCFRTSRTSGSNQKIRRRAMATQSAAIFVVFISLYQIDPVIGCTVTPSAAAVLAGNSVSITCRPTDGESVTQWVRQNINRTVYQAQFLRANRTVAEGYYVDDSNLNEINLTVNSASVQYADNYECICFSQSATVSKDYTYITVIEAEPHVNATSSLSSNDSVLFTCSVKFAGNANLSMQITNSAGKVLARRNDEKTTNSLQQFDLYYNTSVAFEKIYFCNISLTSAANDPKTTIFSRNLTTAVQFSVRNVSISPESPERCQNGGFCETNSVLLCKAEGNPEPRGYSFTIIHQNGTTERSPTDKYTVKYVGQQVIQCTASNEINGNVYDSQSIDFTTNGTAERLVPDSVGSSNGALIGGLVGGLVGGTLLIIIIAVILIWYKRQRSKQSGEARTEDAIETKDFTKGNKGNGQTTNGQTNIAEISGDERVLIDNTLYSGSKGGAVYNAAIDPSAPVFLYGNHRSLQPTHVNMHQLRTSAIPVAQYGYQFSKFQPNSFYARQHY